MPIKTGKHLSKENREVVEDALHAGKSARHIANMIDVAPSTITREVKTNRTVREPKRRHGANLAVRCSNYSDCQKSGSACKKCSTRLTTCKRCRTRNCIDTCKDFKRKMCPTTLKWPYICPANCTKASSCGYPKCRYSAHDADEKYRTRLVSSREGVDISPDELESMKNIVIPLVKQGQSFEAIWINHSDELPCTMRSAYTYQAKGLFDLADPHLPRKARMKKRKRTKEYQRERIDRTGRTYDNYKQLSITEQVGVVQCDSVEGYSYNSHDILTLHIVSRAFQIYLYKKHADAASTVTWLDIIERSLGSPEAFSAVFGILLCDRGVEFDDWQNMERSCLVSGKRRCRVFYCDAMNSNQKSQAERNHEQLRRILPKGRSNFDLLNQRDVATCCNHVNSYPSALRQGKCGFELLGELIPKATLSDLGLKQVQADNVVLKPNIVPHAVEL
jgi:transposase, IS30 family